MQPIISVVQQKGGVGKTTVSICLAGELARRGIELSLVDTDQNASASSWAEPGQLLFPVVSSPIVEGRAREWAQSINQMRSKLLVIDGAPNHYSIGTAVALANVAIVPCGPSSLDIEGMLRALQLIDTVRARRPTPLPVIIVPTRVDSRTLEGRQIVEELSQFGEQVGPSFGYRTDFVRACMEGKSINTFAPGSPADNEVRALADQVLENLPPRRRSGQYPLGS
jgi:chromosome partitioning protein